jgi:hypothetical protein
MNPDLMILSHATYLGPSGATAAATYSFITRGYRPPAEPRHVDSDTVHNQNGKFKYIYDNGPGFRRWSTFQIICQDSFASLVGANASTQYSRLREMWNHKGILGMTIGSETFSVHWPQENISPAFVVFPRIANATAIERDIDVQFEEA